MGDAAGSGRVDVAGLEPGADPHVEPGEGLVGGVHLGGGRAGGGGDGCLEPRAGGGVAACAGVDAPELEQQLLMPALWAELSRAQIAPASSTFEIGRDNPGADISADADRAQVGDFFRRGADANFAAFEETVVTPLAEANGLSNDLAIDRLSQVDVLEQFDAIGMYNSGFLTSRMMTYLAGLQTSALD